MRSADHTAAKGRLGKRTAEATISWPLESAYNVIKDPVHIHDLNATALHLLGFDHTRLIVRNQGRDHRLTDVHGKLVPGMMA